jgi:2-dehydro-3-deoxygluconokinase
LRPFAGRGAAFVALGEVMLRDTPADRERLERTRRVDVSLAGSEYTLAVLLARFGVSASFISRVPDNPYGWMVRDTAREQGVDVSHLVWADKTDSMGRLLYELGRTPRKNVAWYQRKNSAASVLGSGMVDWKGALADCKLLHTSGITFGLANHSGHSRNYLYDAFAEALDAKPLDALVGLDFNFRGSLWSPQECVETMTPLVRGHVDVLITTIEDMATLYGMSCGRYSAEEIEKGDIGELSDGDLKAFLTRVGETFQTKIAAVTVRYPDTFEEQRWESAAMDRAGNFVRSGAVRSMVLWDRLGGGDTWNGGFYYGLLTAGFNPDGMRKGVLVGDAATRLKQTLMFDLPILTKREVQDLLNADLVGGGKRVAR